MSADALPDQEVLVRVAPEILALLKSGEVEPVVILSVHDLSDGTHEMRMMRPDVVAENNRLRAENEALKAAIESAVDSLSWTQCPAYKSEGTCISGCHQEPICQTGSPPGGWEAEALQTLAAVLSPASDEHEATTCE